jgi:hypothetical protein
MPRWAFRKLRFTFCFGLRSFLLVQCRRYLRLCLAQTQPAAALEIGPTVLNSERLLPSGTARQRTIDFVIAPAAAALVVSVLQTNLRPCSEPAENARTLAFLQERGRSSERALASARRACDMQPE